MSEKSPNKSSNRWLIIISSILAVVLLFCALLPAIISTQWGKTRALEFAAPYIPGEIGVETWSLSWLGEQRIEGINYADPQNGIAVNTTRLTLNKGLSSILLDRSHLGTITLHKPAVKLTLPEPASEAEQSGQAESSPKTVSKKKASDPAPTTTPNESGAVFIPLSGLVVVEQGSLSVAKPGAVFETVADQISAEINVTALTDPITFSFELASPEGTGRISGQGEVVLAPDNTKGLSPRPQGQVQIIDWEIARLLDLASVYAEVPVGEGRLGSMIRFGGDLQQEITIEGMMSLNSLRLAGGLLGEDQPFIEETTFEFSAAAGKESVKLTSLELTSPLASGTIEATMGSDGPIQLDADLRFNLQEIAHQFPANLRLQENLQITGGVLTLKAETFFDRQESRFSTTAAIEGLTGIRGGKQISLAEPFSFALTGQRGQESMHLEHFAISSSFLNGKGSGDLNDLSITLKADIKAALDELSQFISLQDYQADGKLDMHVEAKRTDENHVDLVAQLEAKQLIVKQDTTVIVPENPLKLSLDATLLLSPTFAFSGATDINLSHRSWLGSGLLIGDTIVLNGDGTRTPRGMIRGEGQLRLGELGAMLKRFKTMLAAFSINGDSHYEFTISAADDRVSLKELQLESSKLSLKKGNVALIPPRAFTLAGTAEMIRDVNGSVTGVENAAFNYSNWLGNGKVQLQALTLPSGAIDDLTFAGKTDMAKLTTLLNALELLPATITLSGINDTALKLNYTAEQIELNSLTSEIDNFVFTQEAKTYRDKKLIIDTAGTIELGKRRAALTPLHLDADNGTISLEHLTIGDWSTFARTVKSSGNARFDMATILTATADWINLPPNISAAAGVDLSWNVDSPSDDAHRYQLDADLSELTLKKEETLVLSDEMLALKLNGSKNKKTNELTLNQISLSSQPVTLNAHGSWNRGKDLTQLMLEGDLAMDLAGIADLVRSFTELELEMAGKSERPFKLAVAARGEEQKKWWQHTVFNSTFEAELIKLLGIEMRGIEVPISLSDGLGKADISGTVNEGRLMLQPHLDLMRTPPLLTIPDNSRVLEKMQISREMANKLLARIHPLFMGATQMSGVLDLDLTHLSWPLERENLNDLQFGGSMDFHDVRLDSSALIGALLTVLRAEETGLDLSGRQIQFVCTNGRIETNPLRTNLSDSELVIGGSLGLDTTIDYLAQVEITERLVGGDLYNHLEGTMIRVPIGGTLKNPDISAKTVQRAVSDLVNQAGKKKLEEAAQNLLKRLF